MSLGSERLSVYTRDIKGKYWLLGDVSGGPVITASVHGFATCPFSLARDFGFAWDDIGLNFQVVVFNPRGDVAWHGRLESIEPRLDSGQPLINCTAVGNWASLYDLTYQGILATSATPEAMIASLVGATYTPQLSTSTAGLLTTGLTGRSYQTPNGGTDDVRVGDVVLDICKLGTSTGGQRIVPYISFDTARKLCTRALPVTPVARYSVPRGRVKSLGLRRTLSSVANRITVRYKDSAGELQRSTQNNAVSQTALGIDYTGSAGVTGFVRAEVLDITGLSATTAANADNTANARLNWAKRVRNDSLNIVLAREYSVYDSEERQEIPLWKVRPGYWLQIPDLLPRPTDAGAGSTAGDAALSTLFFITETSYNAETGELTIIPEGGSELKDVIA